MTTLERQADPQDLLRMAYANARRAGTARHRDIAQQLAVSEGELIAAHVQADPPAASALGLRAQRLRNTWPQLVAALQAVGPVMALTRNAACVHEKTGVYRNTSAQGPAGREMGLVLGPEIDLRVFYSQWAHGFAVDETSVQRQGQSLQRSLQFFDAAGTAVHKVFTRDATDPVAWDRLVSSHLSADGACGMTPVLPQAPAPEKCDADIDITAFRQAWASLRDTHDFFGLLRRHGVSRTQALRLADPGYAQPVDVAAVRDVLHSAAADALPIMVFTGNPGVIQIHTGPVQRVQVMGPWLNVLDPGFNLHLREDLIAQAWVVRKPTSDGLVTSLELFDAAGQTIAMLFGERKPGRPELCAWRRLVDGLVSAPAWQPHDTGCAAC